MRVLGRLGAAFVSAVLAGCVSQQPSGIVPAGEDTFQASKSGQFYVPIADVRAKVMAEIGQFCEARNMTFVILDTSQTQPPYLPGNYPAVDVHFKCAEHNVEHVR